MRKSIQIFRQLEKVFQLLERGRRRRRKGNIPHVENTKILLLGGGKLFANFRLFAWGMEGGGV
jgi:hypothetical protein